jgi:hypothetical protein
MDGHLSSSVQYVTCKLTTPTLLRACPASRLPGAEPPDSGRANV